MQSLKKIVTNGLMVMCLASGLMVSAVASDFFNNTKASAEQGKVLAQLSMGIMYNDGNEVKQDYKKALMWFEKAANQGDAAAQGLIGVLYEEGDGVQMNKSEAKKWYGKSCDNGNQDGCNYYRELNEQGY